MDKPCLYAFVSTRKKVMAKVFARSVVKEGCVCGVGYVCVWVWVGACKRERAAERICKRVDRVNRSERLRVKPGSECICCNVSKPVLWHL